MYEYQLLEFIFNSKYEASLAEIMFKSDLMGLSGDGAISVIKDSMRFAHLIKLKRHTHFTI